MVVVINTTMAQERTVTGTVTSGEDGKRITWCQRHIKRDIHGHDHRCGW
jgi:hypothetical protein